MAPAGEDWPLADATVPDGSRIYDYLLGGKGSYAADRDMARDLLGRFPQMAGLVRVNRRFVLAGTRWSAGHGIRQFLDLGCGHPLTPALHDAAREGGPSACVIYVDKDPLVACHAAAVYAGPGLAAVRADAADPAAVLELARKTGLLDLGQPACIVLGGTLSAMAACTARAAVAGYMGELVPGSAAIISCVSYDDPAFGAEMSAMFAPAGTWRNHTAADVAGFFGGLRVEGGQAGDVRPWSWPELQEPVPGAAVLGGIGVK